MQKLFLGFEFPLIFFTMHGSNNFLLINWREEKMYRMGLLLCVWSCFLVGVTRINRPGPLPFCLSTFFGAEREEERRAGILHLSLDSFPSFASLLAYAHLFPD